VIARTLNYIMLKLDPKTWVRISAGSFGFLE
jgi:hypothetical protein